MPCALNPPTAPPPPLGITWHALKTHRHGGTSLPPVPRCGLGTVSSLGGRETRQPEVGTESCQRYGRTGRGTRLWRKPTRNPTKPNPIPPGSCGAAAKPQPTDQPAHIRNMFLRKEVTLFKGARN